MPYDNDTLHMHMFANHFLSVPTKKNILQSALVLNWRFMPFVKSSSFEQMSF